MMSLSKLFAGRLTELNVVLSQMMAKTRIIYGAPVKVRLTQKLIREHTFYDPDFSPEGSPVVLEWTLDDVEKVQGHIAAAANHEESSKIESQLEDLHQYLQDVFDRYDDTPDSSLTKN